MSRRERPGKHARAVMSDRRWQPLSLAARAIWLGLTDVGDVVPSIRAPGRAGATSDDIARYLAADAGAVRDALPSLVQCGVLEPVGSGYRLASY
ncbi:hypothetical protein [Gluconobacter sp. Dm-73]|uniref:hypothetical protein n=1 Tax=Gluconobacter sp. Dm-73 TaxID=2799802 RepID=UPI002011BE96|nr:hypothetical protein [Gluconobacter sp. Dm-73]